MIDVSVVIVTWNGRQYLDACLTALALQQGVAWEAILVDNASTDGSIELVRKQFAQVRCVVLSETDEPAERDQAFAVGADVYGLKRSEPDDVASAIRQSFDRSIYHAQGYPGRSEAPLQLVTSYDRPKHGLTNRELEILRLVADGHSNSQLARMLWVTEQTIKFHLSNIYRKLGVANRTEASRWAQLNGVLEQRLEEAIA